MSNKTSREEQLHRIRILFSYHICVEDILRDNAIKRGSLKVYKAYNKVSSSLGALVNFKRDMIDLLKKYRDGNKCQVCGTIKGTRYYESHDGRVVLCERHAIAIGHSKEDFLQCQEASSQ